MSGTPIGSRISAIFRSKIRIKPGEICYFGTMKGLNFDKRFQASWVSSTASWESSTDCPTLFAKKMVKMFGGIKNNAYLCIDKTSKRYESCRRRAAIFVSTH